MTDRVFYDADGELLIVPQQGRLLLRTELGMLDAAPGEIAVVPRGVKFRVELPDGTRARLCLRELRRAVPPARTRPDRRQRPRQPARFPDARAPRSRTATGRCELVAKFEGKLWATELDHSPLDVVAWHGNYAPYKYDLARFNTIGTVSFDHPDPSIFTVLTSPTDTPGTANCDFVIFPPRWMVAEHTFRPPWFHRNVHERVHGPGARRLRRQGRGLRARAARRCTIACRRTAPTARPSTRRVAAELEAAEDRRHARLHVRDAAASSARPASRSKPPALQRDYDACWAGFEKMFKG